MFRAMIAGLLVAGMTAGCATTQPVLTGGYYCLQGTDLSCPSHEGSGDCQPCPRSTATPSTSTVALATPAILPGRQD
jgi:hypothetical protein